jgi:CoA:oxalate CoA-transferase
MSGAAAALGGIRVLDLSAGVAGQYCGKLLAGYGADCVLAEPPEGTPTRRMGPYLTSGRSSTRSAMFRHLNQGKSSLVHQTGDGRMQAVAGLADVVIRDDATPLPFTLPATVVECVIGEFPRGGPYSGWHGSEMVHQALAGAMYMTGWPDRQPLYGIGHRAYYACGTTAFISVLSALHERASSGLGQVVTATVFESNAAIAQNLVSQYSYNGSYETRRQYPGFLALLQCRDHWMVLFAIRHWEQLCEVFGLEHLLDDERFGQQASRLEYWDVVAEMQARARQFLAGELVAALQRARISAEVVAPPGTLVCSAQWRDRQMVRTAGGGAGTARTEAALGPPFTVGDTGYCALRPSPVLRRATAAERAARAIQQRWLQRQAAGNGCTSRPAGSAGKSSSARPGPLSGRRVIDLTTAWAGPFAGRSLAHLGAEVIKVEVPQTEAGVHWIGEHVLLQAETGRSWQPDGNAVADAAPHDAYPCRGDDEWIAIAIGTDEHWRALCQAIRRPDLALSPRYSALPGRARHRHELDAIITRWTRQFSKHELAARLQAAGVPAAAVNRGADVARDTVLLETGFTRQLDHPEAGRHSYPGLAYQLERSPGGISAAAPCFGQHNEPVLRDILGIRAETIAELQRAGAIADRPLSAQLTTAAGAAHGNRAPPNPPAHLAAREHTPPTSRGSR